AARCEAESRECFANELTGNVRAEHLRAAAFAQRNCARKIRRSACAFDLRRSFTTREFGNQSGRTLRSRKHASRIDTALEAIARIADEPELSRSSTNACRLKIGALQQNVSRRFGHACFLAAHHARDRNRALLVSDQQIIRAQFVSASIEREKFLA